MVADPSGHVFNSILRLVNITFTRCRDMLNSKKLLYLRTLYEYVKSLAVAVKGNGGNIPIKVNFYSSHFRHVIHAGIPTAPSTYILPI